jgi:maltooligosyltrehalose trehalohydrolase
MLAWYEALLALRRARPDLTDGRRDRTSVTYDADACWLVVHRPATSVAVNLGDRTVTVHQGGHPGGDVLLAWPTGGAGLEAGGLRLDPGTTAVVG